MVALVENDLENRAGPSFYLEALAKLLNHYRKTITYDNLLTVSY